MSLSDLASLGSFVSGLAVLVSLVFLYFQLRQISQQVRQAERNQQAAIRQSRTTQVLETIASGMEFSAAEAINKGFQGEHDISETSLRQFQLYWRAGFYSWEDAFYQHADGLFVQSAFHVLEVHIKDLVKHTGIRAQWRLQRSGFATDFVTWLDKLVAETPIDDDSADSVGLWRNALAAERSGAPY